MQDFSWEGYFERLKGPVYDNLFKQFLIFPEALSLQVTSYVLGHKISTSEKSIATLLGHYGSGKQGFGMISKTKKMEEIAKVIFSNGKLSSNSKDLHESLRIWFKIFLGCIYPRPPSN